MAGEKDAKAPSVTEERTTERRMLAASAVMQASPPSSRDVASEDFLFHLFRGSELLQDNRMLEAKEELEQALTLQPRDPKGQDLLAVVYFRIGLYPRAISIYEQLKRENPRDPSLKLNLALSYLKTGQAQLARAELEDVVSLHPTHKRAWGYLGLAYERTGELDKAMNAFERSGHPHMVRRVSEKLGASAPRARTVPTPGEAANTGVPAAAFEELDAGEISFTLAEPVTGMSDGGWREPALASRGPAVDAWTVPPSPDAAASLRTEGFPSIASVIPPPDGGAPSVALSPRAPFSLGELTLATRVSFPSAPGVALHASGVALVRTTAGDGPAARPFAARIESIRVQAGALSAEVLARVARGKPTGESFGGIASPLARISGAGELVLAPRSSHSIVSFRMAEGDVVTVREDALLGFDLGTLTYENGKLAVGDGDTAPVVQLRGAGAVLLELLESLKSLEASEGHPLLVRRDALVGWTGRLSPRALPPVEAPGGQRGLLALTGDGSVLLSGG
jgi:Flp pilus assembly protein TadD/uncharacterized protein (AIM24 family)